MNKYKVASPKPTKERRRSFMDDTRVRFILAILSAMVVWLVVVTVIAPNSDMLVENVPVNFAYNADQYTNLGYSMVNDPYGSVTLKVIGDRTVIGSLTKEDFIVYPDYSSVVTAGETSLKLLVKPVDANATEFTVEIVSATTSVMVVFDTVETYTFPVVLEAQGITIADGYVLINTVANPSEVSLTGPTNELDQIQEVVAEYDSVQSLTGNTVLTSKLRYLDINGNDVKFTYTEAARTSVDVELTINKYAELPIAVNFINTPDNFDMSVLDYSFDHEALRVSGDAKVIDALSVLTVGTIDLSTFALDKVYEMPITLPQGIMQQDNINIIKVSFDCTDMAIKALNIPTENVVVKNLPDNYQLSIESERIMNVELCGPQEAIESLAATSVIATIDMDDFSVALGTQTITVKLSVPSNGKVFAIGSYTVDCKIESN